MYPDLPSFQDSRLKRRIVRWYLHSNVLHSAPFNSTSRQQPSYLNQQTWDSTHLYILSDTDINDTLGVIYNSIW